MKPTIYDVAKKAGVSIATVSKVVNNTGRISEKTRKKVIDIINTMDYQPSSVAAALTGKKTFTIGVIVPDIVNPFFAEVARALENKARETGYAIILCSTDYKSKREQEYLDLLLKKQVDGVIMATEPNDMEPFRKLNERNVPLLLFSVDPYSLVSNVVTTDNVRGGYIAGHYLLQKGHRRLAIIAEKNRQSGRARLSGFLQALSEEKLELAEEYMINSRSTIQEAKAAARRLLSLSERPTAVFTATDLIAIILINEARKVGLKIPEDISVIGFDNTIYAEIADPGLTTIAQPIKELANQSFHQLLQSIEKSGVTGRRIMLSPELIERSSVKDLSNIK